LFVVAAAAWFAPGRAACIRVTPVDVKAWHASLRERVATFGDVEAEALAGATAESFRARLLLGRARSVTGREWASTFEAVRTAEGRWRADLPGPWSDRVSPEDESHVTAVFFPTDEPPWSQLSLTPGRPVYLELDPNSPQLLEALLVPAGQREGDVTTNRFFKSRWTVPVAFAWPWRRVAWRLAGLGAALLIAAWVLRLARPITTVGDDAIDPAVGPPPRNPRRRAAWRAVGVTVMMLAVGWGPSAIGMNMMNGGYAIVFVALVAGLSAFVVSIMFFNSARRLDRLFSGGGQVVHWTYSAEEWQRFADTDLGVERAEKRSLFRVVAAIIVVVTVGFVLVLRDRGSLWVAAVMAGLLVVLWLFATGGPAWARRRQLRASPEAWLGCQGVFVGGVFYDCGMATARLDGAELLEVDGLLMLAVTMSQLTRAGRQSTSFRVPVPGSDRAEAQRAIGTLTGGHDE
jgi:hypothetical protein